MTKTIFKLGKWQTFAVGAMLLVPATTTAETFNMPQFGRVEKQVTEDIDFYDLQGTANIASSSSNNSFSTVVFTPANEGEAVQITFSRIHLQGDGANYPTSLSIFDGNYNEDVTYPTSTYSVTATDFPDNGYLLQRYFSGADKTLIEVENVTFTSTQSDGALSVCFLYKYAAACEGWVAKVKSITLTDQELLSVTPDYSGNTEQVYGGLTDVTIGSLNAQTSGILNPFTATGLSFTLTDANSVLDNVRLLCNGNALTAEPTVEGNTYSYVLDQKLVSGDNLFSVVADVKSDATFHSTASVKFDSFTTDAPSTPAIADVEPVAVEIAPVVMMPTDDSHVTFTVADDETILFYDNGGPSANYTEQTSGTVTFKPAEGSSKKVMIDFSKIELFNTYAAKNDQLIVYNGQEVNEANMLKDLVSDSKATIRSTAEDGALTVYFKTITGVTKAGWESSVSAFTPEAMTLQSSVVTAASTETVVAGDTNCELLKLQLTTQNTEPALSFSSLSLDLDGTADQVDKLKLYSTNYTSTFALDGATLLGEVAVEGNSATINLTEAKELLEGDNYFWVLADVKEAAQSGTKVNAVIKTATIGGEAVEIAAPDATTGREVYNFVYISADHPVKTVYGSMAVSHKPYSTYYTGYASGTDDLLVTFLPAEEGMICEVDFSMLNLYYYTSTWYPSYSAAPVFKVFAGTDTEGTLLYEHAEANNFKEGGDNSAVGVIRSTAADGSLTILFNPGTTSSSCRSYDYGFKGEVREYQSVPMSVTGAAGVAPSITAVPVATAINVPVLGVKISTEGNENPVTLESLGFNIKADTSIYTSLKLATSGKKDSADKAETIATAETIGSEVTFTPNSALLEGDNYFWLMADVDANAAPGSVLDASVASVKVNGAELTVTNADPEGEILTVNTFDPVTGNTDQVVEVGEYPIVVNGVSGSGAVSNYTITAKPAAEGGKVTATFTEGSFNVNTSYEYVTVIGGAEAFGIDHDTTYPVSVTSAREDGQLIIEYHSMTYAPGSGWKCQLSADSRKAFAMSDLESTQSGAVSATRGSDALLSGFKFNVTGDKDDIAINSVTFNIPDVANLFSELRLYATGDNSTFNNYNLLASSDATSTTLTLTEPYVISAAGEQNFWLQATVKSDAEVGATATVTPVSFSYTAADATADFDLSELAASTLSVIEGFHGEFHIGQSAEATYANFTDAVNAMSAGIEGPVTFIVEPGTYNERVELNHIPGVSETNTISFVGQTGDPSDVSVVWNTWTEPSYSDDKLNYYYGVITLRGTSYVTFDGLTVRTTNAEMPSVIRLSDGSCHTTISHCLLAGPYSSTTYYNLSLVNTYPGSEGNSNNDLTIDSTDFEGGYCGVKFGQTTVSLPAEERLTITNCSFADQGYQAIYVYGGKDVTITDNYVSGTTASSSDKNYCQAFDLDIAGPASIERNVMDYNKRGGYGLYLRRLEGSADAPIIIANNVLNINSDDKAGAGIQLYNSNSKPFTGFLIAHNTVRTAGETTTMPLIISSKATVDGRIANNIFQNDYNSYVIKEQYGSTGATYLSNAGYTDAESYAYWGGNYDKEMTFSEWAAASGETNGVFAQVLFDESNEANLLYPLAFDMLKAGTPLDEVTTDINGKTRSTDAPTIGAYEAAEMSAINDLFGDGSALRSTVTAGGELLLDYANADVRVYSLSGALLMSAHVSGLTSLNVGSLPRGLCLLQVIDHNAAAKAVSVTKLILK
jgi:hypothetical protein